MNSKLTIAVLTLCVLGLGAVLLLQARPPITPATEASPPAKARSGSTVPEGGAPGTSMQLRVMGKFAEAEKMLREQYAATGDHAAFNQLMGVLEDKGDPEAMIKEGRPYVARNPKDSYARWMLARGLLFSAAMKPDKEPLIREAERMIEPLEQAGYKPPDSPGGLVILRCWMAYLRQQWPAADRLAQQSLKLGTNGGEEAELVAMRSDLAIRAGRFGDAEALLQNVVALMEGWKDPAYYMLRTNREDALIVQEIYFGRPFTEKDLGELDREHDRLVAAGMVDPTTPADARKKMHEAMRTWIARREAGDAESQLALVEAAIEAEASGKDAARCFYSEAIVRPFKRAYFEVAAGDLCRKLGRNAEARKHYETALKFHPDDRFVQLKLKQMSMEIDRVNPG